MSIDLKNCLQKDHNFSIKKDHNLLMIFSGIILFYESINTTSSTITIALKMLSTVTPRTHFFLSFTKLDSSSEIVFFVLSCVFFKSNTLSLSFEIELNACLTSSRQYPLTHFEFCFQHHQICLTFQIQKQRFRECYQAYCQSFQPNF